LDRSLLGHALLFAAGMATLGDKMHNGDQDTLQALNKETVDLVSFAAVASVCISEGERERILEAAFGCSF
jgi:hypothetical protein